MCKCMPRMFIGERARKGEYRGVQRRLSRSRFVKACEIQRKRVSCEEKRGRIKEETDTGIQGSSLPERERERHDIYQIQQSMQEIRGRDRHEWETSWVSEKERQRPDTEIEIERINETYKQTRTDT